MNEIEKKQDKHQNPLLNELLDYLLSVKGYSKNTIYSYEYDLIQFFKFILTRLNLADQNTAFDEINIDDVDSELISKLALPDIYAFLGYATRELGNVDSTRKRKTAAIRSLYHYLRVVKNEKIDDPTTHLETPKIKSRDPVYLTLDEAMSLLGAVDGRHKERDLSIITLFLNCGIRLSELTNLKLSDIQDESLHIVGKGNKERVIYLNDACVDTLDAYLAIRPKETEIQHVFISQQMKPLGNRRVEQIVDEYVMKAGLDATKISVHKLRHTAATLMHNYGQVDIRTLQRVLGHENVATTQIYTHVGDEQVRDALYQNPLGSKKFTK